MRVAEQEKTLLNQNLTEAKQQVEVERLERAKVQDQTTQLAQGVGQLAEKSGQLTQEIRDNRPVNPNQIFSKSSSPTALPRVHPKSPPAAPGSSARPSRRSRRRRSS